MLHESKGAGKERYIEVRKQELPKTDSTLISHASKEVQEESQCSKVMDGHESGSKIHFTSVSCSTKSATSSIWKCSVCGFAIPESNKELHQARCMREARRNKSSNDSHPPRPATAPAEVLPSKKKSRKRKDEKGKAKGGAEEPELDALIAEIHLSNTICNFTSCNKRVDTLGFKCSLCHLRYCSTHYMAELHGCGEAAKKQARDEIRKQLKSGGARDKPLDPIKRQHLQRKLDKKIDDLSSDRQKKKPS